jgi:hypothetical protein
MTPPLPFYGSLPGPPGWFKVFMGWIEPGSNNVLSKAARLVQVRAAMNVLHKANYVRGDARPANTVVDAHGKVWLIDFDWSGRLHNAKWPDFRNKSIAWPNGADPDTFIFKYQDLAMLELNGFK